MNHLQDAVFILFAGYLLYGFYYEYFARVNKMQDEDIIPRYVALVRIKQDRDMRMLKYLKGKR